MRFNHWFTARAMGVAVVGICAFAVPGCPTEQISETRHDLVRMGTKEGEVDEIVRKNRGQGELVQQRHFLLSEKDDQVQLLASLDAQGFAESASYRREGKKGKRYVELTRKGGALILFSRGDDETLTLPSLPVVVLDVSHRLQARPNQDVLAVDLQDATFVKARIDDRGALALPAAPAAPASSDPIEPRHTARAPFLESQTRAVTSWCNLQAKGVPALDAASALAFAAKPKTAPERKGGPPAAFNFVHLGGGDDGAAALVVACLRSLGHPARVVTGTVGEMPRTWAQVHDGTRWTDVDPLRVDVMHAKLNGREADPDLVYAPIAEGFMGPLTTGLPPKVAP